MSEPDYSQLETVLGSYAPSREVAFTCSSSGKGVYVQAWDVVNGAVLRTYTGDASAGEPSCVCMAGEDYVLCALKHKPFIFVWRTHWEHIHLRIACTGIVNALECHPRGVYCIGGITDKINIWELSSGHLLGQLARHYQSVSKLHFINNGHHFLSGGKDGIVITWDLARVLSQERLIHSKDDTGPRPLTEARSHSQLSQASGGARHVWSDHSMAVTGIASIGKEDDRVRVFTCSLDMTCKLYQLTSGILLSTFLFSSPLCCVTPSPNSLWLYTGSINGDIEAVPLFLPSTKQVVTKSDGSNALSFTLTHHKKPVTGIAFAPSNSSNLISSCVDGTTAVCDTNSKQLLRTVKHKGPVVGLLVVPSDNLLTRYSPVFPMKKHFGKQLSYSREAFNHQVPIRTGGVSVLSEQAIDDLNDIYGDITVSRFVFKPRMELTLDNQDFSVVASEDKDDLLKEMRELRSVHKKLYAFAMDKLIP